jgi:Leucine-rich repeat (LRR) protein
VLFPLRARASSGIGVRMKSGSLRSAAALMLLSALCSCDDKPAVGPAAPSAAASSPAPPAPASAPAVPKTDAPKKFHWTDQLLHVEIKFHNPDYEGDGQFEIEDGEPVAIDLRGRKVERVPFLSKLTKLMGLDLSETKVTDLRPLKGLQLVQLFLENTSVVDLSPLRGMPLQNLALSNTPVRDISALQGMPLVELRAVSTQIGDLSALAQCPIQNLWLTDSPVEGIAALKGKPLVTLTLHRTKVRDLTPLSGSSLQRLHIGETPVEDLSPLKGLGLTRLVFTPANIKAGLDVARALPIQEIGTKFDDEGKDLVSPDLFWQNFSATSKTAK